ncbi:hypothetical protein N657DRAFT_452877 [Parathielavia appendiculata]|uniref:Uncharacterized protein n=1 Tax=Parathielavia appendiculata TaxID=2587402 RepID=A0AAN6Z389_9PEZI|nr:hypothetical protein N657DRAFT_452877 [Parathielavia appendiculata]
MFNVPTLKKEGQSASSSSARRCWFPQTLLSCRTVPSSILPPSREPHHLQQNAAARSHRLAAGRPFSVKNIETGSSSRLQMHPAATLVQVGRWGAYRMEGSLVWRGCIPDAGNLGNRLQLPPRISAICWLADDHRARNFRGKKNSVHPNKRIRTQAARGVQTCQRFGLQFCLLIHLEVFASN